MSETIRPARIGVQLRAKVEGRRISGTAIVFDTITQIRGGYEQIRSGAADKVLQSPETDAIALFNHDHNMVLGRQSSGTLELRADSSGLHFDAELPDTSYSNDLLTLVERGDITGASFGFIPGKDVITRHRGRQLRTHTELSSLVDVSIVTLPAYSEAGSLSVRSKGGYDLSNRKTLALIRGRKLKRK